MLFSALRASTLLLQFPRSVWSDKIQFSRRTIGWVATDLIDCWSIEFCKHRGTGTTNATSTSRLH